VLLDRGALSSALGFFEAAAGLVPIKSAAGGEAALQQAITLDSLGCHDDARALYTQLRRHRTARVAKTARAMEYGFDAGAGPLPRCVLLSFRATAFRTGAGHSGAF
jgi:hypothetical protein